MNYYKIAVFLIIISLSFLGANAQRAHDYATQWSKIHQLEKKGLTKDALKEVEKIFADANKTGNQPQQIKSAMYQMKYRNMVEEDNKENNIFYLDTLIAKTKAPAKNILQSMQAELFHNYRQQNRYRLYGRTQLTEENSKDITTWSLAKLNSLITALYKASLENEALLKTTSLNSLDVILEGGKNSRNLRPTLYDLLAHRALSYFMNDENNVNAPAYKFIINDEKVFAPITTFVKTKFTTSDTSSLYYNAIELFQELLSFHVSDANKNSLLDADLLRLSFVHNHGVFANKSALYENALLSIERNYPDNPYVVQAMFLRAQLYQQKGLEYNPFTAKEKQFEIKKAKDLADSIVAKYPGTKGAINAQNLLVQLKVPMLEMETEKVNMPGEAFRTLIKYKNAPVLYLRVIKTSRNEIENLENLSSDKSWAALVKIAAVKNWSQTLPDLKDFQPHSTEIKIDALSPGTYMILASLRPDFELTNNIIARQVVYVSSISFLYNDKNEIYVLHRNTGLPLANAEVLVWEQKYNYNTRKNEMQKKESFVADNNGLVKAAIARDRYNNFLQIKHKGEELFTTDSYHSYNYDSYRPFTPKRTFLFTDRSLYRPGQTVFFKGIVISTDSSGRKNQLIKNFNSKLLLFNVNGEKIGSFPVSTNEYGSFNGSFILPEGALNGEFYLQDSVNQSMQQFSVEEYKRPRFATEIKKPEGTYRLNDQVTVVGNAKAYAGNNIDGARVNYRVVRRVRYPIWWGPADSYRSWPPYGARESMEIINGEVLTDANGNFSISFRAIPDEAVDKKAQPVFYYEVTADVTDLNGETRSGTVTVAVAYQALQLSVETADKLPVESLETIKVFSRNMNELFEKAKVNFSMYKLLEPTRVFRKRYWQLPDQFVMSKEAFYAAFPYDVYANEDDPQQWALGEKVIDMDDSTSEAGSWNFNNRKIAPGLYKIVIFTKDRYGEEVKAEKIIRIFDQSKPSTNDPILVATKNKSAEPGQKFEYSIHTGFNKIWLIQNIVKIGNTRNTSYPEVSSATPYRNEVPVTENDRGGISLNYAFVQHNRVYSGTENYHVPWSNKELQVTYETFRDKILPGSEEKWTVKISGSKGEKTAAELLVNMYDASLDQFRPHSWNQLKSIWPTFPGILPWTGDNFSHVQSVERNYYPNNYRDPEPVRYDQLINDGWNEEYHSRRYMKVTANAYREVSDMAEQRSAAPAPVMAEALQGKVAGIAMDSQMVVGYGQRKNAGPTQPEPTVQIRKNFNETAFFFPALTTDERGNVSFTFTIPEALTQWKLMTLAHNQDLASGYSEKTVLTQKPLMVQPNAPRFAREGDRIELVTKLVNMSDKEITGTVQLELLNTLTNTPVDGWFKNVFPTQYFTAAAGQAVPVKFPVDIPFNFNSALSYRIKAITKDGAFSDGEEAAIPVLTNRMLVTETLPLNLRGVNTKNFRFDKLLASGNSETLSHHALTVEYTANPAWFAVQALPYLTEFPYESAEQNFNRYYANVLASFIATSTPRIRSIFEKWKTTDTSALLSNLQKNEELKSALLEETPWVMEAKNENEQKKNIAILFDMVRLGKEKYSSLNKVREMQSSNGGFSWFKGGPDDRYITQYIVTGIGHLRKLKAFSNNEYVGTKSVADKAIPYLDARLKDEYNELIKNRIVLSKNNLSYSAIQYLYMRSFFPETPIAAASKTAFNYYQKQAAQYWLSQNRYMQAMIALALHRNQDASTANAIIASLKQNAIYHEEMGMYFKEFNTGGYYWHQAPIESQSLIIEAFTDIDGNLKTVDDLKTWLLKQKQTQNWRTTKATADAVYALLLSGSNWLMEEKTVSVTLGGQSLSSLVPAQANAPKYPEPGTGYVKQRIESNKVKSDMGNISVSVQSSQASPSGGGGGTTWGAAYWQYFEDLDKITPAATPLSLVKKLYVEKRSDRGPVLQELKDGDELKVGDKVKVRIELKVDRMMEYIHMKDMRAAAMEPVNVISQYKWQGGLGYYESTKDASTNFFFSHLPRGSYVFEYPMFVTHTGNFSNGITTIQSMYAPEFSSHSNGIRLNIE